MRGSFARCTSIRRDNHVCATNVACVLLGMKFGVDGRLLCTYPGKHRTLYYASKMWCTCVHNGHFCGKPLLTKFSFWHLGTHGTNGPSQLSPPPPPPTVENPTSPVAPVHTHPQDSFHWQPHLLFGEAQGFLHDKTRIRIHGTFLHLHHSSFALVAILRVSRRDETLHFFF